MSDLPSPAGARAERAHGVLHTSRTPTRPPLQDRRSLLRRLVDWVLPGAHSREELIEVLNTAETNQVIRPESRIMLEGVLRMATMNAGDVLVATPRMDVIDVEADYESILELVIDTGHSRFPVYEGERDNIIGILLAKDLLKRQRAPNIKLRTLLRPAVFIPESKALNDVLRDFRGSRNHMAVVIDEFGRVAGIITIEDVVEEIVGEIEDEFDVPEDKGDIFGLADDTYRVSGDADVRRVGATFGITLPELDGASFDTIGGYVSHAMGHVPRRGEVWDCDDVRFIVWHTRAGSVRWFKAQKGRHFSDA